MLLTASLLVNLFCLSGHAITFDSFSTQVHNRFAGDPTFIGTGLNFSGVGMTTSGRWGTLITDQVFLSANHFRPGVGGTLNFRSGNDPSETPEMRTVEGGQRIGSSDLWIGYLDAPVGPSITSYAVFTTGSELTNQSDFNAALLGVVGYLNGRSPSSNSLYVGGATTDHAVGVNFLEFGGTVTDNHGTTDFALGTIKQISGDANFIVDDEAQFEGGDSGGPLFGVSGSSDLVLLGINWAIGDLTVSGSNRDATFYSYPGNYISEIDGFIVTIPEMSTFHLVMAFQAAFLLVVLVRFRCRRG
jgi:hypothetical protein